MFKLIKNELIKILKRKNIYLLLLLSITIILGYNNSHKYITKKVDNIKLEYEKVYKQDNLSLKYYDSLTSKEEYIDILERVQLEKHAINNNIEYNIILNSENEGIKLPSNALILFMKTFNNFDIIIIVIIIYLSTSTLLEELSKGTVKTLLIRPHKRSKILFSKLLTNLIIVILSIFIIIIFQYIIGGIIFGFDSYNLGAIRYNHITQEIENMNLIYYIFLIFIAKMPMYILLMLISFLLSIIIGNMPVNILISLGIYLVSNLEIGTNNFLKHLVIYNGDLSKFLFGGMHEIFAVGIVQPLIVAITAIIILLELVAKMFKNKDIVNQ